jgi:ribosomal protein S12 methylthiotransferase accessory factor
MNKSKQTKKALNPTYSLAPDLEVVPLGGEEWLCNSATSTNRLGGVSARLVIEGIFPLLKNGCSWSHLKAQFPEVKPRQLRRTLNELVAGGILLCTSNPPTKIEPALSPLLTFLRAHHLPTDVAMDRLANAHLTIIGLEGAGAHLALLLARYGLRRFTLVDPYPCQAGDLPLLPTGGMELLGQPRQAVIAQAMHEASYASQDLEIVPGPPNLSPESVAQLVADSDLVVSCFDRGFASIHHWINRASLHFGVPAVYVEATSNKGWVGPLVLPHRTPCYMCYRMRAIACSSDSAASLAHEQYLNQQNLPRLHSRAILPSLIPQLAGLLATTVLHIILKFEQPALAGRVLEFDALSMAMTIHTVLRQPSCPDCSDCNPDRPTNPALPELLAGGDSAVDILQIAPDLISGETGLIREVHLYEKDSAEPVAPYISQVTLANYHFYAQVTIDDLTCWGKGLTYAEARASGMGEAVERYAADWIDSCAIVYARRSELDGPSLDPSDLVLYASYQYATLPYYPYEESSILGWVRGRSLVTGQVVYLPALAVFLGYQAQRPEEYLFPVTSNGLAAGASLVRAILGSAYEVLERDAFMITWFGRLPARRIDPFSHPDTAIQDLCQAYGRRGVEIGLWQLQTDHSCAVFLALGLQQGDKPGPSVVAGLGADLCPASAARKAILEVGQIRPSYRRSLRRPDVREQLAALIQNPQNAATMHDHGLLYCSPAMRPALAFLLDRTPEQVNWTSTSGGDPKAQLEALVDHFRSTGRDFLYYNLTPPDLAQYGLSATKVILPGFQPISFGAQEVRLGGSRLFELPQQLDLAPARLKREDLNPYPHPFD